MQNQNQEWDSEDEAIAWVQEAFDRLHEEVACLSGHWDRAKIADAIVDRVEFGSEMYSAAKHCENLANGISQVWYMIVERFCPVEVILELSKEKMEQIVGEPVDIVAVGGDDESGFGFLLERKGFNVPDDARELTDE